MARIDELFRYLKANSGSDLHLAATLPPHLRKHGTLQPIAGRPPLSHDELVTDSLL